MSLRLRTALALSLALPCGAHAMDFTVTRFDDPEPDSCEPADCSLREAVLAANALAGNDRVLLAAGDHTLTRYTSNPPSIPAGTSGVLAVNDTVEIVGAGRDATRILIVPGIDGLLVSGGDGATVTTTLRDLAIEDGHADVMILSLENSQLRLERVAMRNNAGNIGAIYAWAHLTIIDSLFEGNEAWEGRIVADFRGPTRVTGSEFRNNAMHVKIAHYQSSVLALGLLTTAGAQTDREPVLPQGTEPMPPFGDRVVRNNIFVGNVSDGSGAAVKLTATNGVNRLDLTDNVFEDNHAAGRSGAVWVQIGNSDNTTQVEVDASGSSFIGISAASGCGAFRFGAPLALLVVPKLTLTMARFVDNEAGGDGGALCTSGATTITQTTFANNSTTDGDGGAIYHNTGILHVDQSTLSGNTATGFGGAIAAFDPVEIHRSTLDGNSTGSIDGGGALYVASGGGGENLLHNATLFGNSASNVANALRVFSVSEDTTLRLDDSILQGGCSTNEPTALLDSQQNIESPGDTCHLGALNNSLNVTTNLRLGALTDNGGPTLTRMPQAGSVALNRIIAGSGCTQIDQRGYSGTGGNCDIGAVEAAAVAMPPSSAIFDDGFE